MEKETYDPTADYLKIALKPYEDPVDDNAEAWIDWTRKVVEHRKEWLSFWTKVRESGAVEGLPIWVRAAIIGQISRYEDDVEDWETRLQSRIDELAAEQSEPDR